MVILSNLIRSKKMRNINKRKRRLENLIASKGNTTKITTNTVIKKTNKSVFGLKNKDIIKYFLDLKNAVKNSKIKTIKKKDIIKDFSRLKNKVKNRKIEARKYYDYDDIECKGIRDIKIFYDHIDDDYYKPAKTYKSLDGSYAKYQSDGDKEKRLSIEEYLNMIKPYLRDIIIDHKDEWKIQTSMKNSIFVYKQ